MAKSDLGKYMTPSARSFLRAQQPRILTPTRSSKTIDPSLFKGKKAAAGAPLASRQVAAPIQETGPEAMSITDGEASAQPQMITETQQPIENRGDSARYMIQGGGPKIDLSFLVPERANKAFDPSKAIGGENVPYQESKGIGGFFRRLLGDESNRMNIEAQQAQGAEWREAEKEAQKEERLLNRMREADKPTQARFEATQKAAEKTEATRVAAENERLKLEGERLGLTKQQIENARLDRVARLQAEKEERDIRIENMRTQNAINDAEFGLRSRVAGRRNTQVIPGKDGGYSIFDIDKGEPIGSYSPGGLGMVRKDPNDPNSPMIPGTTPGGWEPYVPPVTVPKDLPDSPQVDRTTGAAPGGPRKDTMGGKLPPPEAGTVVTPPRNPMMPMNEYASPSARMIPAQEESAIDPYQLQRTTPSVGTMIEPAGSSVNNRARYMSPNMAGWKIEPQAPSPLIAGPIPASLSMSSATKKPEVDGTIEYPTVMGDSSVGPFRGPVQSIPLPQGPENLNTSQQYYNNLLKSADKNDTEYTNWLKEKLRNSQF
jgi:hypothetical protein